MYVLKNISKIRKYSKIADEIREQVEEQQSHAFPVVLEIPSKEHPYDPLKDSVLQRIQKIFGDD
jgi:V-type H+-transporting ATPase subunit F